MIRVGSRGELAAIAATSGATAAILYGCLALRLGGASPVATWAASLLCCCLAALCIVASLRASDPIVRSASPCGLAVSSAGYGTAMVVAVFSPQLMMAGLRGMGAAAPLMAIGSSMGGVCGFMILTRFAEIRIDPPGNGVDGNGQDAGGMSGGERKGDS